MRTNDPKANAEISKGMGVKGAKEVKLSGVARSGESTPQSMPAKVRGQSDSSKNLVNVARSGGRTGADNQSSESITLKSGGDQMEKPSDSFSSGSAPVSEQPQTQTHSAGMKGPGRPKAAPVKEQPQTHGPSDSFASPNPMKGQ